MLQKQLKLLETLVRTPSPSGFEEDIAEVIKQELSFLPKGRVKIDCQKNVIAILKGTNPKYTVMIDAHADQIGFITTNIDKDGIITMSKIGGGDNATLTARPLVILTSKGKVNAVVDRKHAHLVDDEEDEVINKVHEAFVDIGIRKRGSVASVVKIGDPIIFRPGFYHLREGYYAGYGFDDKTGCFILIETIKQIYRSKKKPIPNLVFTFSAQEEIGGHKVKPLIHQFKPQLFVEADVTFASDYPNIDEKEVGKCDLGKGIVIYKGVDIDAGSVRLLSSTASTHKIKTQFQASTGDIGYTQGYITPYGIKAVCLGIPLRNMHTPVEIIHTRDLKYGVDLLTNFLLNRRISTILEKK